MARPIFLGVQPHIADYYKKPTNALFDETGGNTGNLAFMYAATAHSGVLANICHFGQSAEAIRAAGDVIVLALANQLGSHTDLSTAAAKLEEIDLPIIGLGLGAQARAIGERVALTSGTARWLQAIADRKVGGPNIGVRGRFTDELITSLGFTGTSLVTGCPSNFLNLDPDLGSKVAARFSKRIDRIAVNAGIPYIPALRDIEQDLASIVTLTDSAYVVQHGLQMVQLARDDLDTMDPKPFKECHEYIAPRMTAEQFKNWCKRYAYAFFDVRAWMDFVRRFDFVVGTRFHGAMLAIQAGVPAGCIAHDSRTLEMCQTMRIPVVDSRDIHGALTARNILDYFKFDPDEYSSTRLALARTYCGIWETANLSVSNGLIRLVKEA